MINDYTRTVAMIIECSVPFVRGKDWHGFFTSSLFYFPSAQCCFYDKSPINETDYKVFVPFSQALCSQ